VRVGLIWAHALCARGPHPPLAHSRPTQSPTGNSPSGTAAAGPHPHSKARKRTQSPAGTSLPRTAAAGPHPLAKARQRTQSPAGNGPPVTIRHQPITATQSVGLGPGTTRHDHGPMRGARNRIPVDDWSTGPGYDDGARGCVNRRGHRYVAPRLADRRFTLEFSAIFKRSPG